MDYMKIIYVLKSGNLVYNQNKNLWVFTDYLNDYFIDIKIFFSCKL